MSKDFAVNLPRGWERVTLGDIAEFIMGQAPPGSECNKEGRGTVFVKAGEFGSTHPIVREWTTRPLKFATAGDVLICVVGATAGKLNLGIDCAIGRSVAAIRPLGGVSGRFVLYQLTPHVLTLRAGSAGSAQGVISSQDLASIPFALPPLAEQERIVIAVEEQLTRLDAARAALKRVQANLKRYRAAMLKAACEGKLVPTEVELARAEGREYETGDGLLETIAQKRHELRYAQIRNFEPTLPLRQDSVGLPEGWAWTSLSQLAWSAGYGTSQKCGYEGAGQPVLRIPNVSGGRIDLDDLKFALAPMSLDDADILRPGDFLVVRTNGSRDLIGRGAVVDEPFDQPHYFASYLIRYRLLPLRFLWNWVTIWWQSPHNRAALEDFAASSAGQYNISLSKLDSFPIALPPAVEITRIARDVERRLSGVDELESDVERDLARAERLRQSVLKRAFEGKLVPQDPNDEPASVLLERIRAERAAAGTQTKTRRGRKRATTQGTLDLG